MPPWTSLDAPTSAHEAWTDSDTSRLMNWFANEGVPKMTSDVCERAVTIAAEANERHAVRDYLRSLAWDGRPRVDGLCHAYLGAEATDYTRAVSISWLVGAVARVMNPGAQHDSPDSNGAARIFSVQILAGPHFSDSTIDFGSKDSFQALPGVWLYELSELDALNRRDVQRVKAFISSRSDRYRPSYGKRAIDVPRQVSFVGTTNATTYLNDDTGARRFLPIRTSRIALDALTRDRDQLWAEAVKRFDDGEPWHISGRVVSAAQDEQEARRITDPWEEKVESWLAHRPTRRSR